MPMQSRRRFLTDAAFAGAACFGGFIACAKSQAAERPPEINKIRIYEQPITCFAPNWVARDLLQSEGFTDVQYVTLGKNTQNSIPEVLLSGEVDFSLSFIPADLVHIDEGAPVVWLAGSHIGCIDLIGSERVVSVRDLKNKTVPIRWPRDASQVFISLFASYVGLDPEKDINWLVLGSNSADPQEKLLAEGKIDAFMTGPPFAPRLRKGRHVLVNTTTDRPWSQYLCCMISSTEPFIRQYPMATKRALRALLKATDLCAIEPERVARMIAERDVAPAYGWHYDDILQGLKEIPYGQWRDYDPEDAVRFYALRMREVGLIKNTPQKLIAEHTDWRFLDELKRELKT
jgi:NitT/TauT family transport system substrate-binding protein